MNPLYTYPKLNGTSMYVFPGAAEDIAAAHQNDNFSMRFSKFVLLNIPRQDITNGVLDIETAFKQSLASQPPAAKSSYQGFGDVLVESLRNYVANHESAFKEAKTGANTHFYDSTLLKTISEKIFWKWAKSLKMMDLEPASNTEDYFGNLTDFNSNGTGSNTDYFKEYLWKERNVTIYNLHSIVNNGPDATIIFTSGTNYKPGDRLIIKGTGDLILDYVTMAPIHTITAVTTTNTINDTVTISTTGVTAATYTTPLPTCILIYNKFVQYIGEIPVVNNVKQANKAYTEVYAFVPENAGQTPTALFRIDSDVNYRPNLVVPFLPYQRQPEIVGAENFNNPIRSNPDNYPGDHYGQFDTTDWTYTTSSGDLIRRSGSYYGIIPGVNNVNPSLKYPDFNGQNIDGLNLDFDYAHYTKMNIPGKEAVNFDAFNALPLNNQSPKDFEFNAVLWIYEVEDKTINGPGRMQHNLYGIEFLDNPNNEQVQSVNSVYEPRIPTFKKIVSNSTQDGLSYSFSTNIFFNINNENVQPYYDPNNIHDLFSFDLFNEATRRLAQTNDQFLNIIAQFQVLQTQVNNLRGLIYTQTDINSIKNRLDNAEELLRLYSTIQIGDSDSIVPTLDTSVTPPFIRLSTVDPTYSSISTEKTSNMFNTVSSAISPLIISIPTGKRSAIIVYNDDQNITAVPLTTNLKLFLQKDLHYKQSVDIFVYPSNATLNKKIDININMFDSSTTLNTDTNLISGIDLPVDLYPNLTINKSVEWKQFTSIEPNDIFPIIVGTDYYLDIAFSKYHGLKAGDTILLKSFILDANSLNTMYAGSSAVVTPLDLSGQYSISSIDLLNKKIRISIPNNIAYKNLAIAVTSNTSMINKLYSFGKIDFNRGIKITITRINSSDTSLVTDRYLIEKNYL